VTTGTPRPFAALVIGTPPLATTTITKAMAQSFNFKAAAWGERHRGWGIRLSGTSADRAK